MPLRGKNWRLGIREKYFDKISSALEFYKNNQLIKNNLLHEDELENWMDTIFKRGAVLYTNCLWYEALKKFEIFAKNISSDHNSVLSDSDKVAGEIRNKLWLEEEGYFCDNYHGKTKRKYFDLAGNVLSVIFGVADHQQAEKILNKAKSVKKDHHILHPINFPRYSFLKISPATFLFGIHNYQNQNSWSWIEILLILAKIRTGRIKEAEKNIIDFSEIFFKNNGIFETYKLDGFPFDHFFWKSAHPFAWSAGLLLWVLSEFERSNKN